MSRSTPSILALLGLVAVAGYQNRDPVSAMLSDARQKAAATGTAPPSADGGFVAEIGEYFRASPLSAALGDLVARFKQAGQGDTANSWVSDKVNTPIAADDLEAALGNETLTELAQKTGLSRADLLLRLKVGLPDVVNRLTPNGRLPTEAEAQAIA